MKVLIFGASGKIGSAVVSQLAPRHQVVRVGSRSGDIIVDYTDGESVKDAFAKVPDLDAVVVAVGGDSQFKPYGQLSDDDFRFGAERKLVAQFRIVRLAEQYLNNNGSVTLTSGFLTDYPNPASLATGPFNSAIDTFVRQTSVLLGRGIRLNVVSPAPVVEPDRVGTGLVSAAQTAEAYVESIEGNESGRIYRVWGGLPQVEKC